MRTHRIAAAVMGLLGGLTALGAEIRSESFDDDPQWDGLNNRSAMEIRPIEQDFGYDPGDANRAPSIGGLITPDGVPAYYALPIPIKTLDEPFEASGTLVMEPGGGNHLLGFFNASTMNEWRTPNTLAFRINGRGETFHAHTEFCSNKWRATAGIIGTYNPQTDRNNAVENPSSGEYTWTLSYDPNGKDGAGMVHATLNGVTADFEISAGLRADGATFDHFGLFNIVKHADGPGRMWIRDLTVNGESIDLSSDPQWDRRRNRVRYYTEDVRPRFNFGFSKTSFAGGAPGEMGGLFFRGDCRYPDKLAYYGAVLEPLTLAKPIKAAGKLTFKRGISDSTTLFGFFNAEHSVKVHDSQSDGMPSDVLGFCIEGPSSQGFFVYPVYRGHGLGAASGAYDNAPVVYPDSAVHHWTLEYKPAAKGKDATIALSLDGKTVEIALPADQVSPDAVFNRFGLVTPWVDGNGQVVYFDDLSFTAKQ
ncbi:MAG: hypothetical protein AMXMBFR84_30160 [Candidatus Hydrogenedentota bacterium]